MNKIRLFIVSSLSLPATWEKFWEKGNFPLLVGGFLNTSIWTPLIRKYSKTMVGFAPLIENSTKFLERGTAKPEKAVWKYVSLTLILKD